MLLIVGRLVGPAEIMKLFGVGKTQARNIALSADFPEPYDTLAMGTVYLRQDVVEWGRLHGREIYDEDEHTPEAP
jgi:prophage regulatory protein